MQTCKLSEQKPLMIAHRGLSGLVQTAKGFVKKRTK